MLHVPIDNLKKNARHKYRHLRCMTLNGDLYKSKAYDKTEHPMIQYARRFSFSSLHVVHLSLIHRNKNKNNKILYVSEIYRP